MFYQHENVPKKFYLEKKEFISIKKEGRRKNYFLTEKGLLQSEKVIQLYRSNIAQLLRFMD